MPWGVSRQDHEYFIFCWNCRGIGNAATIRELRYLVNKFAPSILCVVETQVAKDRVLCLTRTLGFHDCYAVDSDGRSGGLGIFGRKVWILRSYGTINTTFIKEGKTR